MGGGVCCSVLQCVAMRCGVMQGVAVEYIREGRSEVGVPWKKVCVAVCCSVLECVAVCYSVLQQNTYE